MDAIIGSAPLVLVVGPAGTGKTTAVGAAVAALKDGGWPVIRLAPSGKAADVLATEAKCPTDTVAGFLTRTGDQRRPLLAAGTTVILDEAGMVATADLGRLAALAERHRWRLVAVGDPSQLPAVGRGGVFAHWCNTLPHHELATPRRYTQPWEAPASLALRAGNPAAADQYHDHGRLHTVYPALLARQIADRYHRHHAQGRTVAITTNTADTARTINQAIQQARQARPAKTRAQLADGTRAGPGDQIATRRNDPNLRTEHGVQVRNRHTWTVTDTRPDGGLAVTHPQRGAVTLPAAYVARHVDLGWAVTGYGNQGDTVDIGIAALEPGTTRNHAYVALTRGRHANIGYLPDPTGTSDPADQLANLIARPARGDSALATYASLRNETPGATPAPVRPKVPMPQSQPPAPTPRHRPPRVGM